MLIGIDIVDTRITIKLKLVMFNINHENQYQQIFENLLVSFYAIDLVVSC